MEIMNNLRPNVTFENVARLMAPTPVLEINERIRLYYHLRKTPHRQNGGGRMTQGKAWNESCLLKP
jgi:hypothetical protein